jgi:hypothetical protein
MAPVWLARSCLALLAAALLLAASPAFAQRPATVAEYQAKLKEYLAARQPYEAEAAAYWTSIAEKRRARNAKRRNGEPIVFDDYVLTQPPIYRGPPRPIDPTAPEKPPEPRPEIPVAADFLRNAAEHFHFVPQRPQSESEFKREYAKAAKAAGLTRDQIVGIYAFETGGDGTYDAQAGLVPPRRNARAISPAVGYNQLLSTNSIDLLAEHGERIVAALRRKAEALGGDQRKALERKIEVLRRIIAFTRTVPNEWNEHDKLAKTPAGIGVHAIVFDRDIGPLLQTQKLLDSVVFARRKGRTAPLTGAELEMMNFTGDGNGYDMVTMPEAFRQRVPTANFFLQAGYERNPIARRTGVVSALFASINAKMDQGSQQPGARELAAAFAD